MRAAVLRAVGGPLVLEDVEPTGLRPHEVLVRLHGTGICHTDLSAVDGKVGLPLPAVLGHEGAGVVEETGTEVSDLTPGDHVVLGFDSCRTCATCRSGHPAYCRSFAALNYSGVRADGTTTLTGARGAVHGGFLGQSSFATHAVASARSAVKVPDDVPLDSAGVLGCGLLTGAGTVVNVLRPPPGSTLAVWGLGAVGLAAVMAARVAGCEQVVGVDPNASRRTLALELGATRAVDPGGVDAVASLVRRAAGSAMVSCLDTVGSEATIRQALAALPPPGTCATVGFRGGPNPVSIDQGHLLVGRTLTGVIEGDSDPQVLVPRLVEWWREGRFAHDRLVRHYPLDAVEEALGAARRGETVKAVLVP